MQQKAVKQTERKAAAQHDAKTPAPVQEHRLTELHQTIGNHGILRRRGPVIQAKLRIGSPGDKYEREADRVAEQVMRMPEPAAQVRQRQTRPENGEKEPIQNEAVCGHAPAGTTGIGTQIEGLQGTGRPLPESTRAFFEPRFGFDFGRVRVHADARAAVSSEALTARAYAAGHHLVFGQGEYQPGTREGRRLLAHELTHVIQQSSDTSCPTVQRQDDRKGQPTRRLPPRRAVVYRLQSGNTVYHVHIVGHASPRWRFPAGRTPAERNLALSQRRARAVEEALRTLFAKRHGPGKGVGFGFECVRDDHGSSISASWLGHSATISEAGGDLDANQPELRRVDIAVYTEKAVATTIEIAKTRKMSAFTKDWSVKVDSVLSGGFGVAGSHGKGWIKNRKTKQQVPGKWTAGGGGGGIDLPIPSVSPTPSKWADFETTSFISFGAFQGTAVRFTQFSVGIGAAGYSFAYISFPMHMNEGVYVGGFTMNQWGAGGSVTSGTWKFTKPIPPPPTITEKAKTPSEAVIGACQGHRVHFDTGSAEISESQMKALRVFVQGLP